MRIKLWFFGFLVTAALVPVLAEGQTSLHYVPITPCRVVDTRNPNGTFGGPALVAEATRDFPLPTGACGLPSNAAAYAITATVVVPTGLGYLQMWPTGQAHPPTSILNSTDGRTKSSFAIIQAGSSGSITVLATNPANFLLDVAGYFVSDTSKLAFYPLTPCRVADTRKPTDNPIPRTGTRAFTIAGACGVPTTATAYWLNLTAIPSGNDTIAYITAWAKGATQPGTSNVSATTGVDTADSAIVQAGTGGQVEMYTTDTSDLAIDVYGYFAPPSSSGLGFYPVPQCRVLDTRQTGDLEMGSTRRVDVGGSSCQMPITAGEQYVLNATVVPGPAGLSYLTVWPDGSTQPAVSTLNAPDGLPANNAVAIGESAGFVDAYATNPTQLVVDAFGYFAPDKQAVVTISGNVTLGEIGLPGVTVTLGGSATGTATTDSDGYYSFTVLAGGSYTLIPSLAPYTFTPTSQSFPAVTANQSAIPFAAQGAFPPTAPVANSPSKEYIYLGGHMVVVENTVATLVANDGFESGTLSSWSLAFGNPSVSVVTVSHSGSHSMQMTGPAGSSIAQDVGGLIPGSQYFVSAWVWVNSPAAAVLSLDDSTGDAAVSTTYAGPNNWQYIALPFTVDATGKVRIHLGYSGGPGNIYWDDVSLVPGLQTPDYSFESGSLSAWPQRWGSFGQSPPPATSLSVVKTPVHSGSYSVMMSGPAGSGIGTEVDGLVDGQQYLASGWVNVTSGAARLHLNDAVLPQSGVSAGQPQANGWKYIALPFTADSSLKLCLHLWTDGGTGPIYWDDLSVTPSINVGNYGFETGDLTAWPVQSGTPVVTTAMSHSGTYSLQLTGPAKTGIYQDLQGLMPGEMYVVSAWVNVSSGATAWLYLDDTVSSTTSLSAIQGTTDSVWQFVSLPFTVDTSGKLRIHLWYGAGTGAIYFDDVNVSKAYQN